MSAMKRRERAAIEAVARHFSAAWEEGENPPDAYLTIAGKRIALEATRIKDRIAGRGAVTKPRLRFDRVALGLVRRLQETLSEALPDGRTVIVTITAPIWLPSWTAAALEEIVRTSLTRRSAPVEVGETIHGNQIRVRLVKAGSRGTPKVIGFVHNPDSDPEVLLDVTQSLIEAIGPKSGKGASPVFAGDRWLVLAGDDRPSQAEPYRQVCSLLSLPAGFKKILMVLSGGRVATLAG